MVVLNAPRRIEVVVLEVWVRAILHRAAESDLLT